MRRKLAGFVVLCLIASLFTAPLALADAADYAGAWIAVAVDAGDGVKLTEYEGTAVADMMKIDFREDGTLTVSSMGASIEGTWSEAEGGVSAVIDGQTVAFEQTDGQLVNDSDGVLIYLEKAAQPKKSGGLLGIIKANKYAGDWIATGYDQGDGNVQSELDGVDISEQMRFTFNRDGTVAATAQGEELGGSWTETAEGISVTIDGETANGVYQDGKLLLSANEVTIYLERADGKADAATPGPAPLPTPEPVISTEPADGFAGTWNAIRYETGDYWYAPSLLFPDGCVLELGEDGTGSVKVTAGYTEKLTWVEADGAPSVSGSYVFSASAWNADTGELRLKYGTGDVYVFFVKGDVPVDALPGEYGLIGSPEAEPEVTPEPENESEAAQNSAPEVTAAPEVADGVAAFTSPLFSVVFPAGWTASEYGISTEESYSAARYEKKGADGAVTASIAIYASGESVDGYRGQIKRLTEYAEKAGGALEEAVIGGVTFYGTPYENWGWKYLEYAGRAPESGVTLSVTVEQADNAGDEIQPMLDSIAFTLPQLDPPNVDPPMPEDGAPYEPQTAAKVNVGKYALKAEWLRTPGSIVVDSIFNNPIAVADKKLYVLTGRDLYAFSVKGDKLTPDKVFENGVTKLSDSFEYLSAGKDGTLYVSQGIFNTLAYKGGKLLKDNNVSGDVVMHPDGKWGISAWANADTKKVTASKGTLTEEPWVLTGLTDPALRKGRFSMISCVAISAKRVYVAGSDALNGDAQRIAVYDFDGKELLDFGGLEWTQDDAFGSVTGIVETKNGILVQDGNDRDYKLFTKDGEFIGAVNADELLGTNYPWLSSMVPTDGGVYVAAAQRREDQSCDELLLFKISGF